MATTGPAIRGRNLVAAVCDRRRKKPICDAHFQWSSWNLPHRRQSFKIVNHHFFNQSFHVFFDELDVLRMHLIIVLRFPVR